MVEPAQRRDRAPSRSSWKAWSLVLVVEARVPGGYPAVGRDRDLVGEHQARRGAREPIRVPPGPVPAMTPSVEEPANTGDSTTLLSRLDATEIEGHEGRRRCDDSPLVTTRARREAAIDALDE